MRKQKRNYIISPFSVRNPMLQYSILRYQMKLSRCLRWSYMYRSLPICFDNLTRSVIVSHPSMTRTLKLTSECNIWKRKYESLHSQYNQQQIDFHYMDKIIRDRDKEINSMHETIESILSNYKTLLENKDKCIREIRETNKLKLDNAYTKISYYESVNAEYKKSMEIQSSLYNRIEYLEQKLEIYKEKYSKYRSKASKQKKEYAKLKQEFDELKEHSKSTTPSSKVPVFTEDIVKAKCEALDGVDEQSPQKQVSGDEN